MKNIDSLSLKPKNKIPLGALYEKCAVAYCRRKKLKIISRNLRLNRGEIDCLAWDKKNSKLIVIEVRGRAKKQFLPSRFISKQKIDKLKSGALILAHKYRCPVRIILLEVVGSLPKESLVWGLEWFPERLGLSLQDFEILSE
ncbi:MAG: YraN family protein [Deltaproteobacteria bacterium]